MAHMKTTTLNAHSFRMIENGVISCIPVTPLVMQEQEWTLEWRVGSAVDKEKIIDSLERLLKGNDDALDFLRQRAALMLDEMLENALFAAPRDSEGKQLLYDRNNRDILPDEQITLRCSFDGDRLFLEVSDSWGSLSPETVQSFIAMNLSSDGTEIDRRGRGIYFMWHFMDDFYVSVKPGEKTSIGGNLLLYPNSNENGAENNGRYFQN